MEGFEHASETSANLNCG